MTTSIFDGKSIDLHALKFTGTPEIDQGRGSELHQNDVVTVLVTGVIKKSVLDTTKEDQLKRTNTITVMQARLLNDIEWGQVEVALAIGDGDLTSLFRDDEPEGDDVEDDRP